MGRIRTIKPGTFTSNDISALPVEVRWTYVGLWTQVDDEGRWRCEPRLIKGLIWPLDDFVSLKDVEKHVSVLVERGMVCVYPGEDGLDLLHVVKFKEHQRVNHPTPSLLPPCPRHPEAPAQRVVGPRRPSAGGALRDSSSERDERAGEDYRSTQVGVREGSGKTNPGKERKGRERKGRDNTSAASAQSADTAFEEFYAVYPRHVGRAGAYRAWVKAVAHTPPERIIAGAARLASDPNLPFDRQYIPYPQTWLNRGGWDDEPLPPRTAPRGRASNDDEIRELLARQDTQDPFQLAIGGPE